MAANEIRDTPGRLLLGWAVLLTSLVILSWRIHLRPADYEWTEYPTALGDAKYYTALGKVELGYGILFVVCGAIAFLMLLAAVWLAILFASRLTEPIGGLMLAAERVRGGEVRWLRGRKV